MEHIAQQEILQSEAAKRPVFINVPVLRTANERMDAARNLPPINQLLGQIWQKGELHILFADTGAGKSILGVQIADALAKGISVFTDTPNDNPPLQVLYYDFELSDRQFFQRYSENGQDYIFSNYLRIDNLDFPLLMSENPLLSFMELLQQKIRYDIECLHPQAIFIDNISYLHTQNSADQQTALEIMRFLDRLKREFQISICVFAHTPKIYLNSPITINHLAGSKQLSNFTDCMSAIGKSEKGQKFRYLKQIKASRNAQMVYDRENVITIELTSNDGFLHFDFVCLESEFNHLHISEATAGNEIKLQAIDLKKAGKSIREIAILLGVSKSTIGNWIKENEIEDDDPPF